MLTFSAPSVSPRGKVRLASCLLKDREQDWWEEVRRAVGDEVVDSLNWDDFVTLFRAEFSPMVEVQ